MTLKVLVAADSFKGSLTSIQFVQAVKEVADKLDSNIHVSGIPLADGGEGTLDALEFACGGERRTCEVEDPLGRLIQASYLVVDRVAMIELAQSTGLTLLAPSERDPLHASSFGLGQVLVEVLNQPDIDQIILGIGGSATNDGGMGMVEALGLYALDAQGNRIKRGGAYLRHIVSWDKSAEHPRLREVPIVVMTDVQSPLCGPIGASRVYGPQKGASNADVDLLEEGMEHLSILLEQSFATPIGELPGSGAAGGIGAALVAFCGATLVSGVDRILDLTGFDQKVQDVDIVITGEGRTDEQTKQGKAVLGVAKRASSHPCDVISLSGSLGDDIQFLYHSGVTAAFSICSRPMAEREAMEQAYSLVKAAIENVLRLYLK